MNKKCVLILAGGTGGHVIPALAVAKQLQKSGTQVHWLGTRVGLENQLVPSTDIPLHYISVGGIRGKNIKEKLLAPIKLLKALFQAIRLIQFLKPHCVIGFGGFVSGPGAIAALLLRKPLIISEQNTITGLTNRCLAPFASQVLQAFPYTFKAHIKAQTIGNPIREEILKLPPPEDRFIEQEGALRLLILGGSQGASIFNQIIPEAIAIMASTQRPHIWHIAGKNKIKDTEKAYQRLGVSARVDEYVSDMAAAYAWADLVICRAGALTIFELAAAGIASILVPYPHSIDDHQTHNARYLADADAAILLPQCDLSVKRLAALLLDLSRDRNRLFKMAKKAYSLRQPHATQAIVNCCIPAELPQEQASITHHD